jgi:hypothetical protein
MLASFRSHFFLCKFVEGLFIRVGIFALRDIQAHEVLSLPLNPSFDQTVPNPNPLPPLNLMSYLMELIQMSQTGSSVALCAFSSLSLFSWANSFFFSFPFSWQHQNNPFPPCGGKLLPKTEKLFPQSLKKKQLQWKWKQRCKN